MKAIRIYSTDACPKCRALKFYLKGIGVEFESRRMADYMAYLKTWEGWPRDNTAPVVEIVDPDKYEQPSFYSHYDLFDKDGLRKDRICNIVGKERVQRSVFDD